MNPATAKSDDVLADHIEAWDQTRRNLKLAEPTYDL